MDNLERKTREIIGHSFKSRREGTCAICSGTMKIDETIVKLKKVIRRTGSGAYYLPVYFDRQYAHGECADPEPLWCSVHGQSAYAEEEECPLCGCQLTKKQ